MKEKKKGTLSVFARQRSVARLTHTGTPTAVASVRARLVPLVIVFRQACIRFRWDESQRTLRSLNTHNSLIIM